MRINTQFQTRIPLRAVSTWKSRRAGTLLIVSAKNAKGSQRDVLITRTKMEARIAVRLLTAMANEGITEADARAAVAAARLKIKKGEV